MTHIKTYIGYILIFTLFIRCDAFLSVDPEEIISVDDAFSSYEAAEQSLAGIYAALSGYSGSIFYKRHIPMYADIVGGNVAYTHYDNENSFLGLAYDFRLNPDYQDSTLGDVYEDGYAILNAINTLIERAPDIPKITQEQSNTLLSEAHALRALVNFYLVRMYAQPYNFSADAAHDGIVLLTKPLKVTDSAPGRSSVKSCYDQITTDLLIALSFYEDGTAAHSSEGNPNSWITIHAAKALLAKVYLYTQNWQEAAAMASEVIADSGQPLLSGTTYIQEFTDDLLSFSESLFELETNVLTNATPATLYAHYHLPYLFTTSQMGDLTTNPDAMAASEDLYQLYEAGDIRKEQLFDAETLTLEEDSERTYYFTKKYPSWLTYIPIIRISEVYLIRAEAYTQLNNNEAAITDLDQIRQRANALATPTVFTSQEQLLDDIALERRKELAFEGDLFYDLARRGKDIIRTDCNSVRCNLTYPSINYALPIPRESIEANPNIIQNEGY